MCWIFEFGVAVSASVVAFMVGFVLDSRSRLGLYESTSTAYVSACRVSGEFGVLKKRCKNLV